MDFPSLWSCRRLGLVAAFHLSLGLGLLLFAEDKTVVSADKTSVVSVGKTSVVSADKTSVVSADKTSVVSQDIPFLLTTQGAAEGGPLCSP